MMKNELVALSRDWNEAGRRFAADVQERLARFHRGEVDDPQLSSDPRDEVLGRKVLDAVVELNRLGRWQDARRWFDPAHQPFIPELGDAGLPFVVALGEDEALFRRGSSYQSGHLWHVSGDSLLPLPELLAAAISPNREMLALASSRGIQVYKGWRGREVARFPWPSPDDFVPRWVPSELRERYDVGSPITSLEYLCVSDSGLRVAVAAGSGVLVGDVRGGEPTWHLALPQHEEPDDWVLKELAKNERNGFHGDMVHAAMTGDGQFLACGSQDNGHFVFAIDKDGQTSLWSKLGHQSEYPHNACFSSDGSHVALNSCHLYSGATIVAETRAIDGVLTEPYTDDPRTPVINPYLRVYASTWLPDSSLIDRKGAFALAGASTLTAVTPSGEVLHELIVGSNASGIDFCPTTGTLVLGSYSGFLHFLKPKDTDPYGLGYRPFKESKRWCFLKDRAPFQW